jgi:adenine/guanine phosphoribosyltransferase-like PRPP-binding protein
VQPHEYWQRLYPPGAFPAGLVEAGFAVELADGRQLILPVRTLADGQHGLASLIINQASFEVQDQLAADLAQRLSRFEPEVIVGLPTLGLTLASAVAQKLGHTRYVPFGTSRKFWYLPELSVALSSITTPDQQKSLYVDPPHAAAARGSACGAGRRRDFERRLDSGRDRPASAHRRRAGRHRGGHASIVVLAGYARAELA